jgi:hypothetical protein
MPCSVIPHWANALTSTLFLGGRGWSTSQAALINLPYLTLPQVGVFLVGSTVTLKSYKRKRDEIGLVQATQRTVLQTFHNGQSFFLTSPISHYRRKIIDSTQNSLIFHKYLLKTRLLCKRKDGNSF